MSAQQDHPLLHAQLDDLPVSENFRLEFLRARFNTLSDALAFDADALVNEKKLSLHTVTELLTLLDREGLGELFKD